MMVEAEFGQRLKLMADLHIEAARIDVPTADPPRTIPGFRESGARRNLDAENVPSVLWTPGNGLDFSLLDITVLDEWSYPGTPPAAPRRHGPDRRLVRDG